MFNGYMDARFKGIYDHHGLIKKRGVLPVHIAVL